MKHLQNLRKLTNQVNDYSNSLNELKFCYTETKLSYIAS